MLGYIKLQRTSTVIHVNVYLIGGNCEQQISLFFHVTLFYKSNFAATVGRMYCRHTETESDIVLNIRN